MPKFKIEAGWIGAWNSTGERSVEGATAAAACQELIGMVDDGVVDTMRHDYDPGPTFVEFLATEDGSDLPVPGRFTEHGEAQKRERELLFLLDRAILGPIYPAQFKRAEALIEEAWQGWMKMKIRVDGGADTTLGAFFEANEEIGKEKQHQIIEALLWEGFFEEPAAGAVAAWRLERV